MPSLILICSAALIALTLALAFYTSLQRGASKKIAYHAPLDPSSAMAKAQRAHGNAAEYAALLVALFLILGFAYQGRDLGALASWTVIAVTVARFVHAFGFLVSKTLEDISIFKVIGGLVTYLGGLVLAGLVIAKAL